MLMYGRLALALLIIAASASLPWITNRLNRKALLLIFLGGGAVLMVSSASGMMLYPWSSMFVLLAGASFGTFVGRLINTQVVPVLVALLIVSALAIAQFILTGGSTVSAMSAGAAIHSPTILVSLFFFVLPWGAFMIGIGEVALIALLAEHWRRRGGTLAIALVPGIVGTLLTFAFLQFVYSGALPLVPFFTVGWLVSLALERVTGRGIAAPAIQRFPSTT